MTRPATIALLSEYYRKTLGLSLDFKQLTLEDDEAYEVEVFDKDAGLVEKE